MINNDDTDNINQVKKDNIENTDKNTDKNNEDKKIFDINNLKNIDKKYLWIGCGVLLFIIILISFIPKNKDKKNNNNKKNNKKIDKKKVINTY